MKKFTNSSRAMVAVLLTILVFLAASCDLNSNLDEIQPKSSSLAAGTIKGFPVFSFPISLSRVDLFTVTGDNLTGTVTVEIRNADGSVVIGSTTVPASSIIKGNSVRNTFTFSPALTLSSGLKYRIYLTRSNPHNYLTDHIAWRTSSGGVDAYAPGVMNYSPSWILDYAFVTYSDGYVDQQQTSTNYGFAVSNTSYLWQEFVPQKIWIIAQ